MSASGLGVRSSGDIATIVVTVVIVLHAVIVVPSTWLIKRQASIDPAYDSFHDLAQKITQNAPHCLSSPLIRHSSRMRKYAQAGPFHPQLARMLVSESARVRGGMQVPEPIQVPEQQRSGRQQPCRPPWPATLPVAPWRHQLGPGWVLPDSRRASGRWRRRPRHRRGLGKNALERCGRVHARCGIAMTCARAAAVGMLSHDRVCGGGQREAELHGGDQTGGETWLIGRIDEVPGVTVRITLAGALELNWREVAPST